MHCPTCKCPQEVLDREKREGRKRARRALRAMEESLRKLEEVASGGKQQPRFTLPPDDLDAEIDREDAEAPAEKQ